MLPLTSVLSECSPWLKSDTQLRFIVEASWTEAVLRLRIPFDCRDKEAVDKRGWQQDSGGGVWVQGWWWELLTTPSSWADTTVRASTCAARRESSNDSIFTDVLYRNLKAALSSLFQWIPLTVHEAFTKSAKLILLNLLCCSPIFSRLNLQVLAGWCGSVNRRPLGRRQVGASAPAAGASSLAAASLQGQTIVHLVRLLARWLGSSGEGAEAQCSVYWEYWVSPRPVYKYSPLALKHQFYSRPDERVK